jgi:hypothetical protein
MCQWARAYRQADSRTGGQSDKSFVVGPSACATAFRPPYIPSMTIMRLRAVACRSFFAGA